jgi:uncharacterized protein
MLLGRRNPESLAQRLRGWLWPRAGWCRAGRYLLLRLTRAPGTPHGVAAGLAAGVAVSLTPFFGLHLLLSLWLAYLTRSDLLAAALGTLVGNPWTLPFLLLASYQLGHALLGGPTAPIEWFQNWTLGSFFTKLEAVFWPMAVGSLPLGLVAGLATYFALVRIVTAYQEARARRRQSRRALKAHPVSPDAGVP